MKDNFIHVSHKVIVFIHFFIFLINKTLIVLRNVHVLTKVPFLLCGIAQLWNLFITD